MKVFFDEVFEMDPNYQEILIDENNFGAIVYNQMNKVEQHVGGLLHKDIFILKPLSYYEIKLKKNVPHDFSVFEPETRLLKAGLIISNIDKDEMSVYVYNCTHNHIYLKEGSVIGEIK